MDLSSAVRESTLYRMYASYANPRLKNHGIDYLSRDHLEELDDHSEIVEWTETAPPEEIPGVGALRHVGLVSKQGYGYDALVGIPEIQQSDAPVIGASAWFTGTDGHNEHLVRKLMQDGNYVLFSGAEGSYKPAERVKPKTTISLANSAATLMSFAYCQAEKLQREGHDVDPVNRRVVGESRGAMIGMGVTALDSAFNQHVTKSVLVAPCLAKRVDTLVDTGRVVEQVASEPFRTLQLIGSLGINRGFHYLRTVDPNWHSIRHQIAIGGALFSGEAGEFPTHIPLEKQMHLTFFDNDFASMQSEWSALFSNHQNVTVDIQPGRHLSIANPATLRRTVELIRDEPQPYLSKTAG